MSMIEQYNYSKYLAKLCSGCETATVVLKAISQTTRTNTAEDIHVRLEAVQQLIRNLQEIQRHLLYFKNTTKPAPTNTTDFTRWPG